MPNQRRVDDGGIGGEPEADINRRAGMRLVLDLGFGQ